MLTGMAVLAFLAVALGAWLLTTQPAGAQAMETVKLSYQENNTKQVQSFSARDPEGGSVYWSLSGTDAGAFSLSRTKGGATVLSFKKPPNFEIPTDIAGTTPSTALADDSKYEVTVRASDGGLTTIKSFMVEVTVTNMDEPGSVTLTPVQPQTGVAMMARVSDPDLPESPVTVYGWAKSSTETGSYTPIQGETEMMYTPTRDDVGHFIMVTARYRDLADSARDRTVTARSKYAVRGTPAANKQPMFYDQTPGAADEGADEDYEVSRSVVENTPSGTPIGPPFTAYDPDEGDILTYSLFDGDATDITADDAANGDSTKFSIDPRTGQIMTKTELNFESGSGDDDNCTADDSCVVKVVATDPSDVDTDDSTGDNAATSVTVTIAVTNVEEAPTVTLGSDSAAKNAITVDEYVDRSDAEYTLTSIPADYTYGVDPTGAVTWTVEGPDSARFVAPSGVLAFKDCSPDDTTVETEGCPNFEMPMDTDKDNVYEVTVVATDSALNKGMRKVTIKVINVEELGRVTFPATVQPASGEGITAVLKDPDGGQKNVSWQWSIGGSPASTTPGEITNASSATYTPKVGDVGGMLTAKASYTDAFDSGNEATSAETIAVLGADGGNTAPKFVDDGSPPEDLKSATLSVDENVDSLAAATGTTINVTDNENQRLIYSSEGTDGAMFNASTNNDNAVTRIVTITPKMALDHEAKSTLKITLRVTDPFGASATLPVTINVTDQAEEPKITGPKPFIYSYEENGKMAVVALTATDPDENQGVTWTFSTEGGDGADRGSFKIDPLNGMLTFDDSPDYEMPMDGTANNPSRNNVYEVTVEANTVGQTGDSASKTQLVKVKVTDMAEAPEFAKSTDTLTIYEDNDDGKGPNRPIGDPVTATDGDEGDMPTYSLSGSDAASFSIVPATGQIVTKDKLDYEAKDTYTVTVTATDRSGLQDTIDITVEVLDVDEPPTIVAGGISVSGPSSPEYAEKGMAAVGTYEADGENAANAGWTLEGADVGDFRLSSSSGMSTMLMFMSSPNYETPMDADTDNTYMVTVKASHGSGDAMVMDSQDVTVTVTNVEEDGMVTLSPMNPAVGTAVTATLTDPDDGIMDTTWQWSKSKDGDEMSIADGVTSEGAMSSYTPVAGDEGYQLMAKAMYTDGYGDDMATGTTGMVVTNNAPMFAAETTTRTIAENSAEGTNVGAPVTATDADVGDTLSYALSGDDAMYFDIDNMGQIMVGATAMLDYETKRSYMVTVTATDPNSASDSITVTIMVTDVMVGNDATLDGYDANDNEMIEKSEVIKAINDYLFGEGDAAISKADVIRLINMYLFPNG